MTEACDKLIDGGFVYGSALSLLEGSGLLGVEIVETSSEKMAISRLRTSLARDDLRMFVGNVAFCTGFGSSFVDDELFERSIRAASDGWTLCADISPPTSIAWLSELSSYGAKVFLHVARLDAGRRRNEVFGGHPPYLMHRKLLYFEFEDGTSEVWVGSHNWSQRALQGPNQEVSVVLKGHREDKVMRQLLHIAQECTRASPVCVAFNCDLIEWYLILQGKALSYFACVRAVFDGDCEDLKQHLRASHFSSVLILSKNRRDVKFTGAKVDNVIYIEVLCSCGDVVVLRGIQQVLSSENLRYISSDCCIERVGSNFRLTIGNGLNERADVSAFLCLKGIREASSDENLCVVFNLSKSSEMWTVHSEVKGGGFILVPGKIEDVFVSSDWSDFVFEPEDPVVAKALVFDSGLGKGSISGDFWAEITKVVQGRRRPIFPSA